LSGFDELKDYADYALRVAESEGAEFCEVRCQDDQVEGIIIKNGALEGIKAGRRRGVGIRVLYRGGLGFSSTNVITRESLKTAVVRALKLAMIAGAHRKRNIVFSREEAPVDSDVIRPKLSMESMPVDERISFLSEVDKMILSKEAELKGKVPWRVFRLEGSITEKFIINTNGAELYSYVPRTYLEAILTTFEGPKGYEQVIIELGESRGFEVLKEWRIMERMEREVETLVKILREAESPPKGKLDVVLGPQVVGIAVHESVGHPYEADRILGREAAQAGESFVTMEMLGTRIGSGCANVVDDPTIPHSFGYYKYDDEGVRARKRYLIKEGMINEFLHNRETAYIFGVSSNAAARAVSYDREPIIRMANTYVEPGDYSFEELLEDVKLGVYIKTFGEWNIDDRRFNQRYVGKEAYLIEKGELTKLVSAPILEITTPKLWSSVDAVGKEELLEFCAALCGKGDPEQLCPVWMGGPPIRLRKVVLGG